MPEIGKILAVILAALVIFFLGLLKGAKLIIDSMEWNDLDEVETDTVHQIIMEKKLPDENN